MKNKAFTLIEVLIVVLIIGILTSIAVVQYQKSVLKSRFTALMPITKALYEGHELFAMSSGKYTDKLENLDMSTTSDASGSTANINGSIVTLGVNNRHTYVKATRENFDNNLIMFQKGSKYFPGEIHCEAKEGKILANWLCQKELGGEKLDRSLTEGYNDYVINGDGNGVFPKDWINSVKKKEFMPGDTCTGTELRGCGGTEYVNSDCIANGWYACYASTFNNSTCEGNYSNGCSSAYGGTAKYIESTCIGNVPDTCQDAVYEDSICNAEADYACNGAFKGNSACYANSGAGCGANSFSGVVIGSVYSDNSSCHGDYPNSCSASLFKDNSICYANAEGACGSATFYYTQYETTYEGKACCKGAHCPASAPKCDCGIDPSTGQHALSC